jgi:two-component system sensor histidine kinase BaeS
VALLSRLVDDLRDLSLAEAGQLRLDMTSLDLVPFLEQAVAAHQNQAHQRGVSLSFAASLPAVPVEADPQRLGQVVGNLLSNALRHTPQGGGITVTVGTDGPRAVVLVADTGSGIPPEELPRVFDRFYRGDPSRSRATGRSGLGLSIVKGLVEMQGGQVWAESTPGQGSRFGFSLPLRGA